jgi:TIR domain
VSANIFISYRREDSSGHAGRLFDSLSARFGQERIFMDIDSIGPGADFEQVIESTLESSKVVLVVIGREWTAIKDQSGHRRLEDPGDFVRMEVAAALRRSDLVIPILVQGTTMPRLSDLPPDLSALTRRNAWELSDARWSYDLSRLCNAIQRVIDEQQVTTTAPIQPPPPSPRREVAQPRQGDEASPSPAPLPSPSSRPLVPALLLLVATALFAAGLVIPFRDPSLTMLDWGRGEPLGVVALALILSGAAMLGLIDAATFGGSAFGLGLAAFLLRVVVATEAKGVDHGSLTSAGTLATFVGAIGFMVIGGVVARRVGREAAGGLDRVGEVPSGTYGLAVRTAAIFAALSGIALRTASMSLPLRGSAIYLAHAGHLWAGLTLFIVACVVATLVLFWLSPSSRGFVAVLGGFAAEVILRLLWRPQKHASTGVAALNRIHQANEILWISLAILLLAALIRSVLEPRLIPRSGNRPSTSSGVTNS